MEGVAALLHKYPELCLFLSIVLGHVIGRFHFKGVGFGNVVGTLLAGIVIGIVARPELPDLLRWCFFYLFLFSIGYSVGPQFFGSLKKAALPQIAVSLVVCVTGLATVIGMAVLFKFDEGIAVGILSGGMTQSASLGTGLNAIAELAISEEMKATLSAHAPLADAITYGFGDLGLILFLTWLGPLLMGANLKKEAKVMEAQLSGGKHTGTLANALHGLRAYRVESASAAGLTVAKLEEQFAEGRLSVQRLRRGEKILEASPELKIEKGDVIIVVARRGILLTTQQDIGPEVDDQELLAVPMKVVSVVITSKQVIGKTIAELAADHGRVRGVYLQAIQRGEEEIPREDWTVIERGDMMRITGSPTDVDRTAAFAGFVERDLARTDLAFLAGGICLGVVLGMLHFNVGGAALGLGTSGSILVVGLLAGWARSRYPVFGAIPVAAQRLLMDIGLIVFIAVVGLHAGPHAVEAYEKSGGAYFASIFFSGMVVTVMPLALGAIIARKLFGMNPMMVLGAMAGAQTCTPGLNALRDASGSNIGALAYTVPYAISNIVLTIWGPVVVAIVHAIRASS
jgi:putative transport protein